MRVEQKRRPAACIAPSGATPLLRVAANALLFRLHMKSTYAITHESYLPSLPIHPSLLRTVTFCTACPETKKLYPPAFSKYRLANVINVGQLYISECPPSCC